MSFRKNTMLPLLLVGASVGYAGHSLAAVELLNIDTPSGRTKVSIGGYAKFDIRHVQGDVGYQDYWAANIPGGRPIETSHTGFNIRESRLSFKVTHGDISGYVEFDMYGAGGNEVYTNSNNPRMRHFYINYKNWLIGQNWSTFMPLHALPESLDFGGPHVGEVIVRNPQVRYTNGPWQFAIENPETNGDGDIGTPSSAVGLSAGQADPDESLPDIIGRYNLKRDWGVLSLGVVLRQVDQGGLDENTYAANFAGKIKTMGKDDFRFQVTVGDPGRFVSAGITTDIVENPDTNETEVESTTAFTVAYRHFWTEKLRSTLFYGQAETDILERKRAHWGLNLMTNINKNLTTGIEVGNFSVDDKGIEDFNSNYFQVSTKFNF